MRGLLLETISLVKSQDWDPDCRKPGVKRTSRWPSWLNKTGCTMAAMALQGRFKSLAQWAQAEKTTSCIICLLKLGTSQCQISREGKDRSKLSQITDPVELWCFTKPKSSLLEIFPWPLRKFHDSTWSNSATGCPTAIIPQSTNSWASHLSNPGSALVPSSGGCT